jgi:phosphatidate phosphatase APP1
MIRVPEALKEVIQKLAEIHRQGDKRREVEAGLQQLLGDLLADGAVMETLDPDDTFDSTTDDSGDNIVDSSDDDKNDDKIDSTSVVRPANMNVDELVSRLRVLEEKMASIEASPLTSTRESSAQDSSSDSPSR